MTNFYHFVRRWAFGTMAVLLLSLAGCGILNPGPKNVHVSEAKLQQLISSQFPYKSRVQEVLDVLLSNPRMKLDAATNRIHTGLDLGVTPRGVATLLSSKDMTGALEMSYGLRFEPTDNSVRMTDVRVNSLQVNGASTQLQSFINQLGPVLAERVLNDYSLYKLSDKDLNAAKGWGYKPGAFTIGKDGLNITLDPIAQ